MGIGNAISNLGSDVSSGVQSFFGASPETAGTVTDALGGAAAGAGLGALTSAITGGNVGAGALIGGGGGAAAGTAAGLGGFGPTGTTPPPTGAAGGVSAISAGGPGGDLNAGNAVPASGDLGSANLTGNLNTGAGGLDLPQGGAAATEFGSANPAATALGQSAGASVPGSSLAPAASATTGGATTGGGGGNSILNAIKNPSLGTIGSALAGNAGSLVGLGGLTAEAIKGSQPLPQINNLQGTAQGETALGTQLQQAELTGNLPPGAQSSIDQAVKSAQAAIRSQYASMGLSGSTAETEALNNAAMQGPMLGFQIASQMASQGLSDLNLGSQLYSQIMQAQLQSDSQMQQAISNFASAAAGGGGTTVKIGGA